MRASFAAEPKKWGSELSAYRFSPLVHLERGAKSIAAAQRLAETEAHAVHEALLERYPEIELVLGEERVTYSKPVRTEYVLRAFDLPHQDLCETVLQIRSQL